MNIKYIEVIDKLIDLTKKDKINWIYRDFDDPYYDIDKDEFTCEYKITKNKTIDIVITKHNFPYNHNYYMKIYYNNKNPLKHSNIGNAYHQGFNKLFDLFIFVKYYSAVKNEKYKKELIEKLSHNINDYKWKKVGVNSFLSTLDSDPKRNGITLVINVNNDTLFFYIMYKNNNNNQILDIINVRTINDNTIYKEIMKLGIYQ